MGWRRRLRVCLTSMLPGGFGNRHSSQACADCVNLSAWVLRPLCEELADGPADQKSAGTRKRGPELKHRRKAMPRAAVERREARLPDRKGGRHASQACLGGFADRPRGLTPAPAFPGAPLPSATGSREMAKTPAGLPARRRRAFVAFRQVIVQTQFSGLRRIPPIS